MKQKKEINGIRLSQTLHVEVYVQRIPEAGITAIRCSTEVPGFYSAHLDMNLFEWRMRRKRVFEKLIGYRRQSDVVTIFYYSLKPIATA